MNLIKQILNKWFCCHEWKFIEKIIYDEFDIAGFESKLPIKSKWYFVCKKCGKIKQVKV